MQFSTTWHAGWNTDLEHALDALPVMEACPRDLYRSLLSLGDGAEAKTALVSDADGPVALVGLRRARTGGAYEPITNWLVPGPSFPARAGMALPALEALGVRVNHGWWRMPEPPSPGQGRSIESVPTYGMRCDEDFEAHWRSTHKLQEIRRSRRRCERYRVEFNPPGGAEWVVRNWDARWRGEGQSTSLRYRLLIADQLEKLGLHTAIILLDGDKMIGGATQVAHGDVSVAGVLHYLPEYRSDGVGHRLIDLHFQHARETGFREIDIGGGHEYKEKWAPVLGERSTVKLWPLLWRPVRTAAHVARGLRGLVQSRYAKALH